MTKSLHQMYEILQPKSGRDLFFFTKGEIADLHAVIIYCVWFIHFLYWRLMAWNVTEMPFIVWNSAGMWRGAGDCLYDVTLIGVLRCPIRERIVLLSERVVHKSKWIILSGCRINNSRTNWTKNIFQIWLMWQNVLI